MDIVKQPSKNLRIHFLRNSTHADRYFVIAMSDSCIVDLYKKCHRLTPHENSAYPNLAFEWAFAVEYPDTQGKRYLNFVKNQKGIKHNDDNSKIAYSIGDNGWYEFFDLENINNWPKDFNVFINQQRQPLPNATNSIRVGVQTSLF